MQKKKIYITLSYIFIALISISILYNTTLQTTGLVIYSAQPDPTEGKDTYLRQNSFTNYETATTLRIGTITAGEGIEFRPILYFDTSSIPPTNTVTNANFSIYLTSSSNTNNFTLNLYRITSNWTENDSNWYSKDASLNWTSVGSDYDTEIIDSAIITDQIGWYNFTITSLTRDWVDGTSNNYGLLLYAPSATAGDSKEIASSDYTIDTALRPTITIDHTPNAAPTINNISTDSSASSPIQIGNDVTFQINWSDIENQNTQTFICSSLSITTSGCQDTTYCSTTSSSTNPSTCSYITQSSNNPIMSFYVAVCDSLNCSTISTENFFYTNHIPTALLIQPNGGETINQSQGNYSIIFNTTDEDSNPLYANIYYGSTQNSTTSPITTNLNLTLYCTDSDSDTATTNNCTYYWNSSGIYGTYFLTIILNDTFTTTTDSSASSFEIKSIEDSLPPQITSPSITTPTHSGKLTRINTTITDDNTITSWIAFNYTSTNISMTNISATEFTATFLASTPGAYQYIIYAEDLLGNQANSGWQTFTSSIPNASTQNSQAPSIALPYHTIQVTSQLNATNSLRNIYAYLNTPSGFTFLNDYPQNSYLGNFTDNETKIATWFLSVPITENTYTLNATFSDPYSNSWDSSNMQIEVTSAIGGGYTLEISGATEIETTYDYYVESKFKQDATYINPDTISISIYDANGILTSGPSSMTQETTGQYNFTYTVGPSVTEGLWETIINATYSGTSYYINEFWNVVGGPFDVRNITILNSSIDNLIINVTTENTGGANKDLTLIWNLSREGTGEILDTAAETFMVPAGNTKDWTIYPKTTYIGQVRIIMMGYYSGTEKAGAYKTFSTTSNGETPETPTSSGGGGGSSATSEPTGEQTYSLEFLNLEHALSLTKNIEGIFQIQIKNTGANDITNLQLTLENLESKYYTILPITLEKLKPNETTLFEIKIKITDFIGEKDTTLKIDSNEITKTKNITIRVLTIEKYFKEKIEKLTQEIISLNNTLIQEEKTTLIPDLKICQDILEILKSNIEKEEFINAKDNVIKTEDCIKEVENKSSKLKQLPFTEIKMTEYWVWIITWALILILIAVITIAIYILTKKLNLIKYARENQVTPPQKNTISKTSLINNKLKNLKEKFG